MTRKPGMRTRLWQCAAAWLLGLAAVGPAFAANRAADPNLARQGKAEFDHHCESCHGAGPGHPGTQALRVKYQDSKPGVLEERTDLSLALVQRAIRPGIDGMPSFSKSEISDAQMAAIVAYLTRLGKS